MPVVDVSSSQVLQKAFNTSSSKFQKNVSLSDLTKIWRAVGQAVDGEMSNRRGVLVPKFGTFTFNAAGKPIFVISDIFARSSRVTQTKVSLPGPRPKGKLNMSKLVQMTKYPKQMIEDSIKFIVKAYAEIVNKGRGASVRLGFHPVAEVTCNDMDVSSAFLPDFLARQGASKLNPQTLARLGNQPVLSTFAKNVLQGAKDVASTQASTPRRSSPRSGIRTPRRAPSTPARSSVGSRTPRSEVSAAGMRSPAYSNRTGSRSSYQRNGNSNEAARSCKYSLAGSAARPTVGTPRGGQNAALAAHGKGIVDKVKETIIRRGGSHGIHAVARVLRIMDDSGDKKLSREELKYGLRDYGIDLNEKQLGAVMSYFDRNGDGTVDIDEFVLGLAPPMDARRLRLVKQAYATLDRNGDGTVTIEDMKLGYNPSSNPDVKAGKLRSDEWLLQYLAEFETDKKDGIVTPEEFIQYYQQLSASIDNTDFFELMIRNAWHISGGSGWCENTTNRRVVVTDKSGKQKIQEVKNDLFIGKSDEAAMRKNLEDQGLDVADMELYAKMDDDQAFGAKKDAFKNKPARPKAAAGSRNPNTREAFVRKTEERHLSLAQAFVTADRDRSGFLEAREIRRLCSNYNIPSADISSVMRHADTDKDGRINYDEFAKRLSRQDYPDAAPAAPAAKAKSFSAPPRASAANDNWSILKRVLFTPPINLPGLMQKLEVNMSCGSDKIFQSTFAIRLKCLDKRLTPKQAKSVAATASLGQKEVDISDLHAEMLSRFGSRGAGSAGAAGSTGGVKPVGRATNIVDKVRKKIIQRAGSHAIHALSRVMKIMDDDGNMKLSKDELKFGLKDYGVELTSTDMENLMTHFDRDRDGTVSFDEFLGALAPPMNERRLKFVHMAFDLLDRSGDGKCTIEDLKYTYDPEGHPQVREGKIKPDEWLQQYLAEFDVDEKDGIVTREEFEHYYQNLSASIDSDDFWELMMRNAWHISGGSGWCENTTNRRVVVTDKSGKQKIQEVKNDLFIGKSDEAAMRKNLEDQGLDVADMELYAKMDDDQAFGAKKDAFKNKPARPKAAAGSRNPNTREAFVRKTEERHLSLAQAFVTADRDRSGFLEAREIRRLCSNYNIPSADISSVMRHADTDKDGRINYDEFAKRLSRQDYPNTTQKHRTTNDRPGNSKGRRRPDAAGRSRRPEKNKNEPNDPLKAYRRKGETYSTFDDLAHRRLVRARAITKMQNLFRAFKARKAVAYKKKCLESAAKRRAIDEEMRRAEASRLKRPTGNNRGGFYSRS